MNLHPLEMETKRTTQGFAAYVRKYSFSSSKLCSGQSFPPVNKARVTPTNIPLLAVLQTRGLRETRVLMIPPCCSKWIGMLIVEILAWPLEEKSYSRSSFGLAANVSREELQPGQLQHTARERCARHGTRAICWLVIQKIIHVLPLVSDSSHILWACRVELMTQRKEL